MRKPDRLLRRLVPLAAALVLPLLKLLIWTYRVAPPSGDEHLERLVRDRRPAIFAFWHNRLLVCGHHVCRRWQRAGLPLACLTSQSRDGEIAARLGVRLGVEIVRGSTSQGALSGLRKLYRLMARKGVSVITAPDGPRGPAYQCQPGTAVLARMAAAPIVPMAFAASSVWRLDSWDRLEIPKPFSRVTLAVGEPLTVGEGEPVEDATARLAQALAEVSDGARRALAAGAA